MNAVWIWWRRLFFATCALAPLLLWLEHGRDWRLWCLSAFVHGSLAFAICWPRSSLLGPIVNRLHPSTDGGKHVWLTIDDGPSADTLPLARLLQERGVAATFFLRGADLQERSEVTRELVKAGHGVANHSMNHRVAFFWSYFPAKLRCEIDRCTELLSRGGVQPEPWFRCPAGIKNPFLHSLLRDRGLHLAGWTVRALDGVRCNAEAGLARILKKLEPGAIILVHEGKNDAQGNPASIDFVLRLVEVITRAGYGFTTPTIAGLAEEPPAAAEQPAPFPQHSGL